jgi:hypothetical protein
MAETKTIKINVSTNAKEVTQDINQVTQATENLATTSEKSGGKMKVFTDIKNVVTSMVPQFKAAEGGVNSFGASLKALMANPVVLILTVIVGALKFIYEAFQSNVKIGKEIAAVWEGLSAVGTQVKDAIFGLTRALVYAAEAAFKFITLDFKGASEAMKKANGEAATSFNQLTNAANGTTFAIVRGLEKQQQANNKAKKEQAVRESEINKLLVQSREILTDETASIKEKKKALEEVTKAEKASAAEKVRTAKVDLDILKAKAKALGGQAEVKMKQEIRDATIALNEAETENAQTGIKLNRQRKMLLRQEISEGKEAAAAAKERAKEKAAAEEERLKAHKDVLAKIKQAEQDYADSLLSEQDREIANVKRKYQALYDEAKKFNLDVTQLKANEAAEIARLESKKVDLTREGLDKVDRLQINGIKKTKEFQELEKKGLQGVAESKERLYEIEKSIEDKKKKAQEDALSATAGTLGQLSKLLGEQTKAGKAAAIAEATIQTFLSAQKAYSSTIGVPVVGPVLAPINAGLAIAAGIKNIQAITSVKTPGGGGPGPSNLNNTFSGATAQGQAPSFNVVGNSGINQLAQLQQTPVQAYVVSGQVTTAQSLDRNRVENATL